MDEIKSPYYELHKIKPYRLLAIDEAVHEFKKTFGGKKIPVDCVQLAKEINSSKKVNIRIKLTKSLPPEKLARTIYVHPMDFYFISVNYNQYYDKTRNRAKYPFFYSSDRMLNFTLAHEFGHIFLKHKDIPDSDKTAELVYEEDLEANEFAGRLLMPKGLIENCSFSSISKVASEFLVSEQAVLKRLTQLNRNNKKSSK